MKNNNFQRAAGFTRIDLAAITMVVGVLSLLGAQKISNTANDAVASTCTDHMRQLMRAMHLYTTDNGDFLPPNGDDNSSIPNSNWLVTGGETTPNLISRLIDPSYDMLAPYLNGDVSVFRCPADNSTVLIGGHPVPRTRSISMSQAVGTNPHVPGGKTSVNGAWLDGTYSHTANRTFRTYARLADVVNPRPSGLFVFLDEHPDSINDAAFGCMGPTLSGKGYNWIDWPATYHNGAGGFGFMDGHGEIHSWANPGAIKNPPTSAGSQLDLAWLATHVTARIADQP